MDISGKLIWNGEIVKHIFFFSQGHRNLKVQLKCLHEKLLDSGRRKNFIILRNNTIQWLMFSLTLKKSEWEKREVWGKQAKTEETWK